MSMKKCSVCGRELPEENFYRWKYSSDGLRSRCKTCCKTDNSKYYKSHRDELVAYQQEYVSEHREKVSEFQHEYWEKRKPELKNYNKAYRDQKRAFIDNLKTPCVKCGESRLYVIDFHHKNPETKEFTLSDVYRKSEEVIVREVQKCICLCSNCHREFHYLYGANPEHPLEALEEYLSQ